MKVSDRWKIIFLSKREANSFLDGSFFFFFSRWKDVTEWQNVPANWVKPRGSFVAR